MAMDDSLEKAVAPFLAIARDDEKHGKPIDAMKARYIANLMRITDLERRVDQLECFIKNNWPPEAKNAQSA